MTPSAGLTSGRYFLPWLEVMSAQGATAENLLQGTGLEVQQFRNDPPYLSQRQLEKLFNNAHAVTGNSLLGLDLGLNLNFAAHGSLGYAGLTARNVREALGQMIHYLPLVTGLITIEKHEDERQQKCHSYITAQPGVAPQTERMLVQTVLCSVYIMTRFLLGNDTDVDLNWAIPPDERIASRLRGPTTHIAFNQSRYSIGIPLSSLDTTMVLADEQARLQAIQACEKEMQHLEKQTSLSSRIYSMLLTQPAQAPSIDDIADQYYLSARTIHRRLQDEGTCFRDILNASRMTLAKQHLCRDKMSITETAYRLGYGDSANFTRAFKRSEGITPSAYVNKMETEK
jgi:AraC-like DNA-binding protein